MNLNIVDLRLSGTAPRDTAFTAVITVDAKTPMHDLITRVLVDLRAHDSKLEVMRIMSHGNHDYMQICKEGLGAFQTFVEFSRLKGTFDEAGLIALQGCNLVHYGGPGVGMKSVLMKSLAEACGVHLLGSSLQEMYSHNPIDFGSWEGNIHLCSPGGTWYRLGSRVRRRELNYEKFVSGIADRLPERLLWRIWGVMFPEGRPRV